MSTYSPVLTNPSDIPDYICEWILKEFDTSNLVSGGVEGSNSKLRSSKIAFIDQEHWISGVLYHYLKMANDFNFGYDINGIENPQLTEYKEGQYYDWHMDYSPIKGSQSSFRKLSVTVQLSDEKSYGGGELEFLLSNGKLMRASKRRGSITVFDSRTSHRVTEVTSGTRKSLVAWFYGPPLR